MSPEYDQDAERNIAAWFDEFYTIRFRNYPVEFEYLHSAECVPCASG